MPRTLPRSALLLVLLITGGCAQGDGYPSLAPRRAELADAGPPAPPVPTVIADDTALAARIAELRIQAQQGQQAFEREAEHASSAAERAGKPGSESWIEAQQIVSYLETVRAPSVTALAELDQLTRSRAEVPTSEADRGALAAASEEFGRIAEDQQQLISRLTASLR